MSTIAPERTLKDTQTLRARAERLAAATVDASARGAVHRFVLVTCGGERLALLADRLSEMAPLPEVLPLPEMPAHILGIAQIRGEIFSVVDLVSLWTGSRTESASMVALMTTSAGRIGFVLDSVEGFRDFYDEELSRVQQDSGTTDRPVRGITNDLISIIDIDKLLQDVRLIVGDTEHLT